MFGNLTIGDKLLPKVKQVYSLLNLLGKSPDHFLFKLTLLKLLLNNFTQLNLQNKRINPNNKVDLN